MSLVNLLRHSFTSRSSTNSVVFFLQLSEAFE